jgi:hypothetical protein
MASLASINIRFFADLAQFSKSMQNVNRQMKTVSAQLQNTGKSLTLGLTAPLTGLGVLATKTFADFEQEMAKVQAISGATADQFKALEENAKTLGATTRFTASEVAGLQLNFSKLGFNPDEILKVTDATLDLALATGEDLAASATVAASTLRGFGLDASQTGRVADVMAASFSSSALDLEKFSTAMAIVGPVAKTAGASIEDATGLLSVLVNAGIDASTAGTGLRNIFLDISKNGLTLEEALDQINSATNKNAVAMDLFGKRGATVATVLAENISQAVGFSEAYGQAEGSARAMAEIMDNTLQGAFFRLKSAIEGAFIGIGEQLAPALNSIAEAAGGLVTKFNNLSPSVKKFIVVLAGVAAAVGPLLALAGTILPAISTGFALLTGPVGLIAAALAAIAVIVIKNWAPIKKVILDIANYFIDLYNESTLVRVGINALALTFKNVFDTGRFVFETLKSIISGFVDNVVSGFKQVGRIVKAVLSGDLSSIPAIIAQGADESIDTWKGFTDEMKANWKDLTDNLKENGQDAIDAITQRKKIEILSEDVDASGLEDSVSDAVAGGIASGINNIGTGSGGSGNGSRPQIQAFDTSVLAAGLTEIDPITPIAEGMPEGVSLASQSFTEFEARMGEFKETTGRILEGAVENFAAGFGQLIAGIASGAEPIGSIIGFILNTIGDLLQQLGRAAIQIGISMQAIKLSFSNPFAAIAAGIAAIALGGLVKAFIPKDLQAFQDGGIVGGSSYYGDKILARVNSGELILNQDQQRNLYNQLNNNGGAMQPIALTTRISGEDILLVQERANRTRSRES